ncbi:efflux RND transporter permease subunit [Aquariibacter albus]|uniref:Efflux RND transporter permease subunit n=1 Tax=Aquariibacter albus TaxID=2759899 RepID=A0A839HK93_9BURK|nr:efflux RND transporter permease subunit [Aquariibacter albus]MBB1162483.1 efflux RND transporter permease subunit [Aquariibacter albus]
MWFTRVSIANPVLATMVMLALVVLGLFGLQRLKVDQFPDIEFPVVVVQIAYPGASPEIVESEVTEKVEEAVNTIAGINLLTSRSYEGQSVVIIQFNLDIESRRAAEDVREKVAALRPRLRDEVEEPQVTRFDPASRPIYTVALTSPDGRHPPVALSSYAEQTLKKRLENVRGVGAVSLVGAVQREVNVYLRPEALAAHGIGIDTVLRVVRTENRDLPAGTVRSATQERVLQVRGRLARPEDLRELVVGQQNGKAVRLGQVAEIADGPQELETLALYNGRRTLALEVLKSQGENTVDVVDGLDRTVRELQAELPPGMALEVVRDGARPIRVAVKNVRQTLLEGALLTVGIVFLFLNSWRSTVITGLALPIALIGTFAFMAVMGFSINMITLMAMSLSVGLLIDDAIVVRENIVRHVQMGKAARPAALDGTAEIGLAVLATTLSIVAVFLPVGLMGGIIGKFFHEFGLTIVVAVLISMFVSFTLDPMLSSVWHDPSIHRLHGEAAPAGRGARLYAQTLGRLTGWIDHGLERSAHGYARLLGWSLRHRRLTLLAALGSLLLALGLLPRLGTEFVPRADFGETQVSFHTPPGTALALTEQRALAVEAALRSFPEVRQTLITLNSGQAQGSHQATVLVRLVDRHLRQRGADQLAVPIRRKLAEIAGITVTQVGLLDAVGGTKPISLSIQADDLATLRELNARLLPEIARIPGLVDLDSSLKADRPTLDLDVHREAAADLGLSVGQLTDMLRGLVAGETVGDWRAPDGQSYDLKVRLAPEARDAAQDFARLQIPIGRAADGSPRLLRLDQVATLREGVGASQINRRDLKREVEITANVSGRALGEVSADLRRLMEYQTLPPGARWRFGGATKDMQESFGYAIGALVMAVIFIYMILASQFRSFLQPLALMSSLPLTLIGVVGALMLFGSTMNMFSIIGIVMLMGLVTKNAILLVDFANRARRGEVAADGEAPRPMGRDEALLLAARVRLRPILMTTLAMIFGMVPLAFALSEGSEQRAPMGQAVIGGVITSSLLTLVVVPVVYVYLDRLGVWVGRRLGAPAPGA